MPRIVPKAFHNEIQEIKSDGSYEVNFQSKATIGKKIQKTISIQPTPNPQAFQNGSTIYFDIQPYEVGAIDDICFRWTLQATSSDVGLTSVGDFVKKITIQGQKGQDDLAYIYPDQFQEYYWFHLNNEDREHQSHLSNFEVIKWKSKATQGFKIRNKDYTIFHNQTKQFYMPIPVIFFKLGAVNMKHIRSDLRFKFELNEKCVLTGKNSLKLINIEAVINTRDLSHEDEYTEMRSKQNADHKYTFLDVERLEYNDKQLNNNTSVKYALDQFVGKSPFLTMYFKASTSPSVDKVIDPSFKYLELGNDAKFDLENSSGTSLMGDGTKLTQADIYQSVKRDLGSNCREGMYVLRFDDDMKKSLSGILNSFHTFVGQKDFIAVDIGSSGVSETHSINFDIGVSAGRYAIDYGGIRQNGSANYNEVFQGSNLNEIVNKLRHPPTIVGTPLDKTINISFTPMTDSVYDETGLPHITSNFNSFASTSLTTRGVKGWAGGSDYTTTIYLHKFRQIITTPDGIIKAVDL